MLRKIVIGFTIIILYVLQCTLFKALSLASVSPNLLLILTVLAGFLRGKKEGMYVGFFSGMVLDLFYGKVIGFNALLFMYIGYTNGFFNKVYYNEEVTLPIALVSASDFVYNFMFYIFAFLLRARLDFGYYLIHIIIPEMIYTVVVTLIIYRLALNINRKIESFEKRSETKFG